MMHPLFTIHITPWAPYAEWPAPDLNERYMRVSLIRDNHLYHDFIRIGSNGSRSPVGVRR